MKKWLETDSFEEAFEKYNDNMGEVDTKLSEKVQNFKLKNEIVNGDFSDGTVGWHGEINVVDGVGQITGNGSAASQVITQVGNKAVVGNKYYYRLKARVTNGIPRTFRFHIGGVLLINGTLEQNIWAVKSSVITAVTNDTLYYAYVNYNDNATQSGKIFQVDDVIIIDLTQTFGAGNEPSKEEMDELMKVVPNQWWDGELDLTQQQYVNWLLSFIRETADKQQEEWITPTLLNGWVEYDPIRSPKYMIDSLGFVHLKGAIKGGSIGAGAFILPVGFQPNSPLYFPVVSNFSFGSVGINTGGYLTPTSGNNGSVYLDGITFRAEA